MTTTTELKARLFDEWVALEVTKGVIISSSGTFHDPASGKFTGNPNPGAGMPSAKERAKMRRQDRAGSKSTGPKGGSGQALLDYMSTGEYAILDMSEGKTKDGWRIGASTTLVENLLKKYGWDHVSGTTPSATGIRASLWKNSKTSEVGTVKFDGRDTYLDFRKADD